MKIRELEEEFPWTVTVGRSEGCHLSDVIRDLLETLYKTQGTVSQKEFSLQYEKGYLWEVALSQAFGEKAAIRPGEIICDGIACSPDGIQVDGNGNIIVEEFKATTMSANKPLQDIQRWMMQIKAYCFVMETNRAIMRIFYMMGDYKTMVPQYRVVEFKFEDYELEENWIAILNHARYRGWVK
jgi:hypothetical protein